MGTRVKIDLLWKVLGNMDSWNKHEIKLLFQEILTITNLNAFLWAN